MYHSITFGDKNTWTNWHLIPSSRPVFNPPKVKTQYVDLLGVDGQLDSSDILTGYATYENRTGSIEFVVANDFWSSWSEAFSTIQNYLHGQKMRAVLEDDPEYYYEGRFSVNTWKSNKNWSTITIDYNVDPFKRDVFSSGKRWLWDTFSFVDGVITDNLQIVVSGTGILRVEGSRYRTYPTFISTASIGMAFKGKSYNLVNGRNVFYDVILDEGTNEFSFSGNGTVSLEYRGGSL